MVGVPNTRHSVANSNQPTKKQTSVLGFRETAGWNFLQWMLQKQTQPLEHLKISGLDDTFGSHVADGLSGDRCWNSPEVDWMGPEVMDVDARGLRNSLHFERIRHCGRCFVYILERKLHGGGICPSCWLFTE